MTNEGCFAGTEGLDKMTETLKLENSEKVLEPNNWTSVTRGALSKKKKLISRMREMECLTRISSFLILVKSPPIKNLCYLKWVHLIYV